jgi:hypothetical protein
LNKKATSPLYEATANYGDWVEYEGDTPVDISGERPDGGTYRLFSGWDKSGLALEDKNIYAKFDEYEYNEEELASKQLEELTRVQVYAISKKYPSGAKYRGDGVLKIPFGNDFNYEDITFREGNQLFGRSGVFDGTSVFETQEKLFDGTRDFTLAIDFSVDSTTTPGAVIFACSTANGGFEVTSETTGITLTWGKGGGAKSITLGYNHNEEKEREMLVLRHKNKSPKIDVYYSQKYFAQNTILKESLTVSGIEEVLAEGKLIFGGKMSGGSYTAFSKA